MVVRHTQKRLLTYQQVTFVTLKKSPSLLYALFKAIRSKLKSIIHNKKETVKTLARIGM